MPASNIRSGACVISFTTSSLFYQGNRSRSSRFYHIQNPLRSQYSNFNSLQLLLQKRDRLPENGSNSSPPGTHTARLPVCFLKSVAPGRTKTFIAFQSMNILQLQNRSHHHAQMLSADVFSHPNPNAFIDQNIDDTNWPTVRMRDFNESGQALSLQPTLSISKRAAGQPLLPAILRLFRTTSPPRLYVLPPLILGQPALSGSLIIVSHARQYDLPIRNT